MLPGSDGHSATDGSPRTASQAVCGAGGAISGSCTQRKWRPQHVHARQRPTYLLDEARRHEPDRYLCALLAPAERRDALLDAGPVQPRARPYSAGGLAADGGHDPSAMVARGAGRARRGPAGTAASGGARRLAPVLGRDLVEPAALHALIDAREPALERIAPEAEALEPTPAPPAGPCRRSTYAALGGRSRPRPTAPSRSARPSGWSGIADALRGGQRRAEPDAGEAMPPVFAACRHAPRAAADKGGSGPGGRRARTWRRSCRPR